MAGTQGCNGTTCAECYAQECGCITDSKSQFVSCQEPG